MSSSGQVTHSSHPCLWPVGVCHCYTGNHGLVSPQPASNDAGPGCGCLLGTLQVSPPEELPAGLGPAVLSVLDASLWESVFFTFLTPLSPFLFYFSLTRAVYRVFLRFLFLCIVFNDGYLCDSFGI